MTAAQTPRPKKTALRDLIALALLARIRRQRTVPTLEDAHNRRERRAAGDRGYGFGHGEPAPSIKTRRRA